MTEFKLIGSTKEKLEKHHGLFTKSYQEVRAKYDAKIRNWDISFKDNLFYVENSEKEVEKVFYNRRIQNCSCKFFLDVQCGTCMHIEAVHLLEQQQPIPIPDLSCIVYINHNYKAKQFGQGEVPFFTPSVKAYFVAEKQKELGFCDLDIDNTNVFSDFGIDLFDFQQESIRDMIRNIRTVLVLEMGLGKTLCALACCRILAKNKIIIIAPNSLKYQWQQEINRFKLGSSLIVEKGSDLSRYYDQKFIILSYEMLNHNPDFLKKHKFDISIADEIQKIKNPDSVSWKTIASVKSEFMFALSGTPIQNSIDDLVAIIKVLHPYELKPEWKFYEEFCDFTKAKLFGIKSDKLESLKSKFSRFIINPKIDFTKFKRPSKKEEIVFTKLNEEQKILHDGYFEQARILLAKSIEYPLSFEEKQKLNRLLTSARVAATDIRLFNPTWSKSERFSRIEKHILDVTSQGNKILIYSEWIKTLNLLVPFLEENYITYSWFHGGLNARQRDKQISKFIQNDNIKVFLSTDSGGLGLDGLQLVCHHIAHVETLWNPKKIDQRNGRLVRHLQKSDFVNISYFKSECDIENMMASTDERKRNLISNILK